MENKEYNIAKGHIAELIVNEILRPKKGKVDKKYYVELTRQLHTLELDDGEDAYREHLRIENPEDPYNGNPEEKFVMRKPHLNTLTREQKLKLFEFIGEKFWNMRPKQLQEMEDEFGEDGLMKCFNELRDFLLDEEDDYFSPSEDDKEVDNASLIALRDEDIGMVKECYSCRKEVYECNWYKPDEPGVSNSMISCYDCMRREEIRHH